MKYETLERCKDYHVHCNYNDHSAPELTVANVVQRAESIGLKALAFTEHVRKSSEWIPSYLAEINSAATKSDLEIITGFEAKILRDGSIDCPDRYASEYFVVASFHTRYDEKSVWISALEKAIENADVDVIGHIAPEPSFTLDHEEVLALGELIKRCGKKVELNAKYHRPPAEWVQIFASQGVVFHLGSDAHAIQEIGQFDNLADLISIVEKERQQGPVSFLSSD